MIRRILERSGFGGRRIIATGGGSRSVPWMQAVADATGLPVDTVAVPEGAALGAAYLARMAAGLESSFDAAGRVGPGRAEDRAGPGLGPGRIAPLRAVRGARTPDS